MYPINKSSSGYSYKHRNATINIQFSPVRDRTGVSCLFDYVQCGDLFGSSYEIIDDYARGQSSVNSATNGYYDMFSAANMNLSAYANNDITRREVSSPIEFAIPIEPGIIKVILFYH